MKILPFIFTAIILFSAGTADAYALLQGIIRLPETANLTTDNIRIYVAGREQKTAKLDFIQWFPEINSYMFHASSYNLGVEDVVMMTGETVVAIVTFNGSTGFGVLTFSHMFIDFKIIFGPLLLKGFILDNVCVKL
jgi:hypothetical protein